MGRRLRVPVVLVLVAAGMVFAVPTGEASRGAASKSKVVHRTFKINLTFEQKRDWTYFYEQRSDCTRTTHGSGQALIKLSTTTQKITLPVRNGRVVVGLYPMGLGLTGSWARVGQQVTDRGGSDCGPDGPTSDSQATDGCGTFPITLQFANLEVNPRSARLTWESGKTPAFTGSCPDFDGSNDVAPGQPLIPGDQLRPMTIPFAGRLLDPKKATAHKTDNYGATETCMTLNEPCDAATSYNASGKVERTAKLTLVRVKTRR